MYKKYEQRSNKHTKGTTRHVQCTGRRLPLMTDSSAAAAAAAHVSLRAWVHCWQLTYSVGGALGESSQFMQYSCCMRCQCVCVCVCVWPYLLWLLSFAARGAAGPLLKMADTVQIAFDYVPAHEGSDELSLKVFAVSVVFFFFCLRKNVAASFFCLLVMMRSVADIHCSPFSSRLAMSWSWPLVLTRQTDGLREKSMA